MWRLSSDKEFKTKHWQSAIFSIILAFCVYSQTKITLAMATTIEEAATDGGGDGGGNGGGGSGATNVNLNVVASDENSTWWRNAVFYQIYPRSFMDSNGDGIGDLRGITAKLTHLAETGITAIWLSPIFQSPMVDFGYDISDFKAIQSEYGSMQDFEDLIATAKRLDIKIILDFVPNHTSDQCEWFQKSAARVAGFEDFYIWADAAPDAPQQTAATASVQHKPPNNWQSVFYGSAWTWHAERQQFYLHQFTDAQPDLNYRNPQVVAAMNEVLLYWLDKGVAGFRVDAVNHLFEAADLRDEPLSGKTNDEHSYDYTEHIYTKNLPEVYDMLHHWRRLLDAYSSTHAGPQRIMMTEAYADTKLLADYYENVSGERGAHFPFNFCFITDLQQESDARDYVHSIQKWLTYMPRGHVANWVMGNHDNARVASRFGEARVDAMHMLLLTLPGVAITYNGEEIGMQDHPNIAWEDTVDPPARNVGPALYKKYSRDAERTPFQWNSEKNAGFSTAPKTWLPVHPDYKRLNLEQQQAAAKSHYKVYKALVALKRQLPALSEGRLQIEVLNREVFAYTRTLKGHTSIITLINTGAQPQSLNLKPYFELSATLTVLVSGVDAAYEKGHVLHADDLNLLPYEGIVCVCGRHD